MHYAEHVPASSAKNLLGPKFTLDEKIEFFLRERLLVQPLLKKKTLDRKITKAEYSDARKLPHVEEDISIEDAIGVNFIKKGGVALVFSSLFLNKRGGKQIGRAHV